VAQSPLQMVILGGILNALYLMAVSVATIYLSYRQTDRVHQGRSSLHRVPAGFRGRGIAVGTISLFDNF
jgi:hypothetical protein